MEIIILIGVQKNKMGLVVYLWNVLGELWCRNS